MLVGYLEQAICRFGLQFFGESSDETHEKTSILDRDFGSYVWDKLDDK